MSVFVVEIEFDWSILFGQLEIVSQIVELFAYFALGIEFENSWFGYIIGSLLDFHCFEDMCW